MRLLSCFVIFTCAGCALNSPPGAPPAHAIRDSAASDRAERGRAGAEHERAVSSRDVRAVADWSLADADRVLCVNEVNRYRTTVGRNALVRSPALESFAAEAARVDQLALAPHRYFRRASLQEPRAENEIPWWPLESFQSVADVIRQGIKMFWDEGPGGGHHKNMLGPWREVGCGGFVGGGAVTIAVEFR